MSRITNKRYDRHEINNCTYTKKVILMQIKVNGIQMNYQVKGQGRPMILLHGNGEHGGIFKELVQLLAENFTVYTPDSRCHGKSQITEDISYDLMAEDMIGFIKALKLEKPILYGFSDGGIIGLLIAVREPQLLSELIISGANIFPRGIKWYSLLAWRIRYLFDRKKSTRMMLVEPDIKTYELNSICVPVHVVAGANDIVSEKHTRLIADNIPGSTLDILPGENHGSYVIHSDKMYDIIKKYINMQTD